MSSIIKLDRIALCYMVTASRLKLARLLSKVRFPNYILNTLEEIEKHYSKVHRITENILSNTAGLRKYIQKSLATGYLGY